MLDGKATVCVLHYISKFVYINHAPLEIGSQRRLSLGFSLLLDQKSCDCILFNLLQIGKSVAVQKRTEKMRHRYTALIIKCMCTRSSSFFEFFSTTTPFFIQMSEMFRIFILKKLIILPEALGRFFQSIIYCRNNKRKHRANHVTIYDVIQT